jgi:hypothetical protein
MLKILKKMKRFIILIVFLAGVISVNAQNEVDALRYSRLSVVGTARSSGIGGAFGALGADFSSLSVNPAGIALFRSSEFSITPSIYMADTKSNYFGEQNTDSKSNFNLGNVGYVSVTKGGARENSALRNIVFGIGLNRTNNFNARAVIQGFNPSSSLLTSYVDQANGLTPSQLDNFGNGLAYDADLIYTDTTNNTIYFADMPNGGVTQRKIIETTGSMNEMVLSLGANLLDKFYIGATLGVPYVRYFEHSIYSETDNENRNSFFNSFQRTESLSTTGSGINFKLGVIYKPADFIRIGAAIHSPTYYARMTDKWNSTMVSHFDNGNSFSSSSPYGEFGYSLTTPLRAIGSIALIFGKYGLLSADYEYVDYPGARLNSDSYDFMNENNAISNKYKGTGNIRLGTEWKYGQFSFRGGYGIEGDPYKSGINNSTANSFSLGLGLREQKFYMDLGFVHTTHSENYYLYDPTIVDPSRNKLQGNSILLTFGVRY